MKFTRSAVAVVLAISSCNEMRNAHAFQVFTGSSGAACSAFSHKRTTRFEDNEHVVSPQTRRRIRLNRDAAANSSSSYMTSSSTEVQPISENEKQTAQQEEKTMSDLQTSEDDKQRKDPDSTVDTRQHLDEAAAEILYSDIFNQPLGSLCSVTWTEKVLAVMEFHAHRRSLESAEACQALFNRISTDYSANKDAKATERQQLLLSDMYAVTLEAWARSSSVQMEKQAQFLFDEISRDQNAAPRGLRINNAYLLALKQCQLLLLGDPHNGQNALRSSDISQKVRDMTRRAHSCLEEMSSTSDDGVIMGPDKCSFDAVLSLWSKSGDTESGAYILKVLEWMEHSDCCSPDTSTYNIVLDTLVKNSYPQSYAIVDQIIGRMKQKAVLSSMPNVATYNILVTALARNAEANVEFAERAESIVRGMEMEEETYQGIRPDMVSYSAAIDAWSRCRSTGSAQRAETLLEHMAGLAKQEKEKTGESQLWPNTVVINSVLSAYARTGGRTSRERVKAIVARMEQMAKMEDKVERLSLQPSAFTYTTILDTLAKSMGNNGDATEREAREIFNTMQKAYQQGNKSAKPTVQAYNTLLNVFAKSSTDGSAQRALEILRKMEIEGDNDVRPNIISYSTVMNALAKSREAGSVEEVENLLQTVEHLFKKGDDGCRPNAFTYGAAIDAYVRNSASDAALLEKADALLKRMLQDYTQGGNLEALPNKIMYTNVIDAYSKYGGIDGANKAEALVLNMELLWRDGKKENPENNAFEVLRPSSVTYSAAINAWAKSRKFGKAQKAYQMLQRMIQLYKDTDRKADDLRPNVFAFTAVMNACAYTVGEDTEKSQALKIAAATYKQSKASNDKFGQPNHVTYATFLRACSNLIPPGPQRDSSLRSVFEKCQQDGQVSDLVLKTLRDACSRELVLSLIGDKTDAMGKNGAIDVKLLPLEWSRGVSTKQQRR
jgi:predicted hydrolase (HD superfamily)